MAHCCPVRRNHPLHEHSRETSDGLPRLLVRDPPLHPLHYLGLDSTTSVAPQHLSRPVIQPELSNKLLNALRAGPSPRGGRWVCGDGLVEPWGRSYLLLGGGGPGPGRIVGKRPRLYPAVGEWGGGDLQECVLNGKARVPIPGELPGAGLAGLRWRGHPTLSPPPGRSNTPNVGLHLARPPVQRRDVLLKIHHTLRLPMGPGIHPPVPARGYRVHNVHEGIAHLAIEVGHGGRRGVW
mmetsp:Transcript_56670/g.124269  ORF Transcript_56670/g.124269 Transcript_56670/m.124269 type:complete len:237 (+) Transcript_56670:489-1199(+)